MMRLFPSRYHRYLGGDQYERAKLHYERVPPIRRFLRAGPARRTAAGLALGGALVGPLIATSPQTWSRPAATSGSFGATSLGVDLLAGGVDAGLILLPLVDATGYGYRRSKARPRAIPRNPLRGLKPPGSVEKELSDRLQRGDRRAVGLAIQYYAATKGEPSALVEAARMEPSYNACVAAVYAYRGESDQVSRCLAEAAKGAPSDRAPSITKYAAIYGAQRVRLESTRRMEHAASGKGRDELDYLHWKRLADHAEVVGEVFNDIKVGKAPQGLGGADGSTRGIST